MRFRHKYAFNGGWFFGNVRGHMERNNFPRIPIGRNGGIDGWYLTMKQNIINNKVYYCPFICTEEKKPMLKIRKHFNIVKKDGTSDTPSNWFSHLKPTFGPSGKQRTIDEYLKKRNGYLTNGGILIEFGFQIEGILSPNNIWTFNFYDPLFECREKKNMISFQKNVRNDGIKFLHCHKQLLTFHSTYFDSDSKENQMIELTGEDYHYFKWFLQLTHGVIQDVFNFYYALIFARRYKFFNVIQLIDQFIVSNSWDQEQYFPQAIYYDLNHYLANFLKNQKTLKELVGKLEKVEINKMAGEAMKKCVKRFFEF